MTDQKHHPTLTVPYQTDDSNLKLSIVTFDDLLSDFNNNNYIIKLHKYDFNSQLKMYSTMPLTDIPVLPMNEDVTSYIQYFHEVDENLVMKITVEQLHSNTFTKVAYLVRTSPMKHPLNLQRLSKSLNREGKVQERSGSRITELINEEDEVTTSYNIVHPTNNKYRQQDKLVRIVYLYVQYNMYETIVIVIIISSTVLSSLLLYSTL